MSGIYVYKVINGLDFPILFFSLSQINLIHSKIGQKCLNDEMCRFESVKIQYFRTKIGQKLTPKLL